jgi:predicted nuclease of predicted toxin-antitoxin system
VAGQQLKFYTDKHIPKAVARQLTLRGVDIVRCEDVGLGDESDIVHLEYAAREGRVIITHDDFARLASEWQSQGKPFAGIILCLAKVQGQSAIGKIVNEVMLYHELIEGGAATIEADIANRVLFVR